MSTKTILTSVEGRVATITLHRPEALNALNTALMNELVDAVHEYDANPTIGCIVITGSSKAFAAGADIKEMQPKSAVDMYVDKHFDRWDELRDVRTPLIAAVSGYALGGGCELAMMCDFILAADTAVFGQPEINLGVTPGMGGSQRLTRAIGKAKAMEMCLTGRHMGAVEAEAAGLVARVVPAAELAEQAAEVAATIAAKSSLATALVKEEINAVDETSLSQGLVLERRLFQLLFASEDQSEGMAAFIDKRAPHFNHR